MAGYCGSDDMQQHIVSLSLNCALKPLVVSPVYPSEMITFSVRGQGRSQE